MKKKKPHKIHVLLSYNFIKAFKGVIEPNVPLKSIINVNFIVHMSLYGRGSPIAKMLSGWKKWMWVVAFFYLFERLIVSRCWIKLVDGSGIMPQKLQCGWQENELWPFFFSLGFLVALVEGKLLPRWLAATWIKMMFGNLPNPDSEATSRSVGEVIIMLTTTASWLLRLSARFRIIFGFLFLLRWKDVDNRSSLPALFFFPLSVY